MVLKVGGVWVRGVEMGVGVGVWGGKVERSSATRVLMAAGLRRRRIRVKVRVEPVVSLPAGIMARISSRRKASGNSVGFSRCASRRICRRSRSFFPPFRPEARRAERTSSTMRSRLRVLSSGFMTHFRKGKNM